MPAVDARFSGQGIAKGLVATCIERGTKKRIPPHAVTEASALCRNVCSANSDLRSVIVSRIGIRIMEGRPCLLPLSVTMAPALMERMLCQSRGPQNLRTGCDRNRQLTFQAGVKRSGLH